MPKKALDLFCGCGGLSIGMQSAGLSVVAGIDNEEKHIVSFRENLKDSKALVMDLRQAAPIDIMKNLDLSEGELFMIAGGPPCQGFSHNVIKSKRSKNNPNNLLIYKYVEFCKVMLPKFFLMENVEGVKNDFGGLYGKFILRELRKVGYNISCFVLNSADFGVPQRRKRSFFLGSYRGIQIPEIPKTNFKINTINPIGQKYISVWDAISDLPSVRHEDCFDTIGYASEPRNNFQYVMRHQNEGSDVVFNHSPKTLSDKQYERFCSLEPGQALNDLPLHLRGKAIYKSIYGRLTEDMIAPTITRCSHNPGSGRWGHPRDLRLLTMREVARIQSFPDNFKFMGSYVQQAGQIGNAVPPLLAEKIVRHILAHDKSS